jgi:hypothetical protein
MAHLSVASLTADQKVRGLIPTPAETK